MNNRINNLIETAEKIDAQIVALQTERKNAILEFNWKRRDEIDEQIKDAIAASASVYTEAARIERNGG